MSEFDDALALIESDLAKVKERETAIVAERERLENERSLLRSIVARVRGGDSPGPAARDEAKAEWRAMPRTDAIVRVLVEHGSPAGPAEVARMLRAMGRDADRPELVGAAMEHLKKQGRVERIGYGQWVARSNGSGPAKK